jgi:hypothetical protein
MKNLKQRILESEYRKKKILMTGGNNQKKYLESLRFQINLNTKLEM